jgi:hypothetical protein
LRRRSRRATPGTSAEASRAAGAIPSRIKFRRRAFLPHTGCSLSRWRRGLLPPAAFFTVRPFVRQQRRHEIHHRHPRAPVPGAPRQGHIAFAAVLLRYLRRARLQRRIHTQRSAVCAFPTARRRSVPRAAAGAHASFSTGVSVHPSPPAAICWRFPDSCERRSVAIHFSKQPLPEIGTGAAFRRLLPSGRALLRRVRRCRCPSRARSCLPSERHRWNSLRTVLFHGVLHLLVLRHRAADFCTSLHLAGVARSEQLVAGQSAIGFGDGLDLRRKLRCRAHSVRPHLFSGHADHRTAIVRGVLVLRAAIRGPDQRRPGEHLLGQGGSSSCSRQLCGGGGVADRNHASGLDVGRSSDRDRSGAAAFAH